MNLDNQKLIDYEKVCKIIHSCRNSRHNNVAFNVCINFEKKHGRSYYSEALFLLCDQNICEIMR